MAARKPDESDDGAQEGAKKPFLLRLSPDLMAELRGWAAQELRSVNGQIEYLLRRAVNERKDTRRRRPS
jgi:hypothetical protein